MFMEFDNDMGSPFENPKKEKKNWTKIAGLIIPEQNKTGLKKLVRNVKKRQNEI